MKFGVAILIIESMFHKREIKLSGMDFGWGNGYVLLPKNHPLYGEDYDAVSVNTIDIHGGLTYGCEFDSNHFIKWINSREIDGDVTMNNYQKFNGYWMFGFDTSHLGDSLLTCPKSYVMSQTINLLEQCISDDIYNIQKYKRFYQRKDKLKKIDLLSE